MAEKPTYEELEQRNRELEGVVESIGDGVCILDTDFRILYENKIHRGIFGENEGEYCYTAFHSREELCDGCPAAVAFKDKRAHTMERMVQKDEGVAYYEVTASPLKDSTGTVTAVIESIRDITERRWTENALRESEERFRAMFEHMGSGVAVYEAVENGKDFIFKDFNSSAERITRISRNAVLGNRLLELFPHMDRSGLLGALQRVWKTGRTEHLPPFYFKDETREGWRENRIYQLPSGEVVAIFDDVTERKRAEEALRDSKQRLNSIIRAVPDIIYRLDSNGNISFISDAVKKYAAYSPEELLSTNILQLVHPDDRKGASYRINERRTKERATQLFEVRLFSERPVDVLSEGESEDTEGELVFLITAEGLYESEVPRTETFIGTQGIARNVTERRRLEAKLRQSAKMEAVGTLAGGIAHDFNNLLMGIQGNVSLMKLEINPRHPYYQRLINIEKQIESGARLTSRLLGYARKGKYEVKPTDLNSLLKDNTEAFGRTRKDITIRQELDDDLFTIEADPGQIQQVLFNLFINASDAMPMGGELILKTMNTSHDPIKNKLYDPKPGNYVLLTVTDTGIGMDKETMKHIFEPFFTTKKMGHGTGLGLASAYGIIKSHGGYIEAESKKGNGTTFSIYLPASERTFRKTKHPVEEITGGTETVLLVDDEPEILDVTKELLETMGYEVLTATNGMEAVEVYRKNYVDIDIVVMDLVMPIMGGGEAYDRIREINTDVKFLLSSGFSIDGEAKAILQRGCNGFIQKPFRMDELSEKIRKILDKK